MLRSHSACWGSPRWWRAEGRCVGCVLERIEIHSKNHGRSWLSAWKVKICIKWGEISTLWKRYDTWGGGGQSATIWQTWWWKKTPNKKKGFVENKWRMPPLLSLSIPRGPARILSNAWWPPRAAHVLLADGASQSSARSFQPKPVSVGQKHMDQNDKTMVNTLGSPPPRMPVDYFIFSRGTLIILYQPSLSTATGWGVDPLNTCKYLETLFLSACVHQKSVTSPMSF